jgi:spectinomycin phosphotransferase
VLAPLRARDGALSVAAGGATLILYPFAEGRNGFEVALAARQWVALGQAMKRIHEAELPSAIARMLT